MGRFEVRSEDYYRKTNCDDRILTITAHFGRQRH